MLNKNRKFFQELVKKRVIKSQAVFKALSAVDRADFCPQPYVDHPIYLGYNATISAPHMHAFALEMAQDRITQQCKILDVGSGSGYLCAAFAMMKQGVSVVGIEHIKELVDISINNLKKNFGQLLQNQRIKIILGDARKQVVGKYKIIHVGAACSEVPKNLLQMLVEGGRMIVPIGGQNQTQWFTIIDKIGQQTFNQTKIMAVRYIPLTDAKKQILKAL